MFKEEGSDKAFAIVLHAQLTQTMQENLNPLMKLRLLDRTLFTLGNMVPAPEDLCKEQVYQPGSKFYINPKEINIL